jgi:hypothetical protein
MVFWSKSAFHFHRIRRCRTVFRGVKRGESHPMKQTMRDERRKSLFAVRFSLNRPTTFNSLIFRSFSRFRMRFPAPSFSRLGPFWCSSSRPLFFAESSASIESEQSSVICLRPRRERGKKATTQDSGAISFLGAEPPRRSFPSFVRCLASSVRTRKTPPGRSFSFKCFHRTFTGTNSPRESFRLLSTSRLPYLFADAAIIGSICLAKISECVYDPQHKVVRLLNQMAKIDCALR